MRPDVIAWSKAQARALVAPQVAEIFERDPRPFFQAIFDFISPQIVFGRVALLGDAAFLARPHPGAGTTKCAMDAEHLADSIAALGIEAGLAKYQREQGAFGSGSCGRASSTAPTSPTSSNRASNAATRT